MNNSYIRAWKPDWALLATINWAGSVAALVFIFGSPLAKAIALMFITAGLVGIAGMVFTWSMLLLQHFKRRDE